MTDPGHVDTWGAPRDGWPEFCDCGKRKQEYCVTHNRPVRVRFVAAACPNDIGCHVEFRCPDVRGEK